VAPIERNEPRSPLSAGRQRRGDRQRSAVEESSLKKVSFVALLSLALLGPVPEAQTLDPIDPAHNVPIPCELVSTPGMAPRSAKNIVHVANVCGFVGTDVEFQSRRDANGAVHDYAFVGTMGAGMRIFDITDPAHPTFVGAYLDPGLGG